MTLAALAKRFPESLYCFSTNSSYRRNLFRMCNWYVTEGHQRTTCAGTFNAASVVVVEYRDLKISEMHKVTAWKMVMITIHMPSKCDHNNYGKNTWTKHIFVCWIFLLSKLWSIFSFKAIENLNRTERIMDSQKIGLLQSQLKGM